MTFAMIDGMGEKRIVLKRADGLYRILGHMTDVADQLPATLEDIDFHGYTGSAHHTKTTPKMVLYQEFKAGTLGVFNDFNPGQR